jgi:hypothetical protein
MNPARGPSTEPLVALALAIATVTGLCLVLAGCGGSGAIQSPQAEPPAHPERKLDEDIDQLAKKAGTTLEKTSKLPPLPAQAAAEAYSPRRLVAIPVDPAKLLGRQQIELWVTADGGKSWSNQGEVDVLRGPATYLAPRDGRYGFLIVPLMAGGVRNFTPKPGDPPDRTIVVDTAPPVVEVLAPNGGETLGGGRSTLVRWVAQDANLHPEGITLEASTDSGQTWGVLQSGLANTGSYHWEIRLPSSTRCRIRVRARDLAGNEGMATSERDFTVDASAPALRITGPAASTEIPARVTWTGGEGLKRITLWVTRDEGRTWAIHSEEIPLTSPFLFNDLEGKYGLLLVGENRAGNANLPPVPGTPPPSTLLLDKTPPEVKLLAPQGGGVFGGVAVDVRWTAKDNLGLPANAVSLQYSPDDGRTWSEIKAGLPNEGVYKWTPPKTAGKDSRIKATAKDFAGNEGVALSARFGVDLEVPEARAIGPDRSRSNSVNIQYEIRNRGSAPIRKVTLYYRPEHVKEWLKYGDDPDQESPVLFAKADGKYGIYVIAATEAGLESGYRQKAPEEGTEPQLWLTIDATPPQLSLETFNGGGYMMAGAASEIVWKMVEPNPDPRGMEIYHSPDGGINWNVVATGVDPTKGLYRWIVPNSQGSRHKIRLVASDRFGNRGQVESEKPFTIDNDLPILTILERPPAVVRSSRLSAKYKAVDHTSGIDRVVLFAKKLGEKGPYKERSTTPQPEGTIECDMPGEGAWACLIVAYDLAGHPSAEPDPDTKPDFVAAFDMTKPEIAIRYGSPQGGLKSCLTGNWEVEWDAKDNFSPKDRIAIRIDLSSDGGKTWKNLIPSHPNSGKADLRSYLVQGKKYRIRLIAIDEAGNEAEDVSTDIDPGDVPFASIALRGVEDGKQYSIGSTVVVAWQASDKGIREATLELSKDGARTWASYAEMHTPSMRIILPEKAGRFHLRVTARDVVARPVSSNVIQFDTIEGVESVRIVANPTVAPAKLMMVVIEPKSIVKTAKELRLEISEDGLQWRKITDVRTSDLTFLAPAVPSDYTLRVAVKAPDGREYDSNHFKFKVTGKDAAIGLQLQNFRGGEVYAGDRGRVIALKTTLNLADVVVEFSDAGGREGTWKEVARELLEPVSTGLLWKRLPGITIKTCRLRVSYKDSTGALLKDESDRDFGIDSTKPVARVVGPASESAIPVRLEIQVDASISPVKQAVLYVLKGATWDVHGRFDLPGPVLFSPAEPGDYGLYLVTRSEAGLAGDPPLPGTLPQLTVLARGKGAGKPPGAAAGPLAFTMRLPDVVKGGSTLEVTWTGPSEGKVKLSFVVEGKITVLQDELPATGSFSWTVPKEDVKSGRLVLELGEVRATSRGFALKSHPPEIRDASIELRR